MEETKEVDDTKLTDSNIQQIEQDALRLKRQKEVSQNEENIFIKGDVDDLSNYTHEEDGVKVLDDTGSINKKAIFHDLNRLKHWRQSMEQEMGAPDKEIDKSSEGTPISPIIENNSEEILNTMDKHLDGILSQMPDVASDSMYTEKAAKRLGEIENKLQRRYTLDSS